MMAAKVSASGTSFEAVPPVALFQTRIVGGGNSFIKHQYAVSSDGRFLINQAAYFDAEAAPPDSLARNTYGHIFISEADSPPLQGGECA